MPKIIGKLDSIDKLRQMFKYREGPETGPWEIPEDLLFVFDIDLALAEHKIVQDSGQQLAASGADWLKVFTVPNGKMYVIKIIQITRTAGDGTFNALRFYDTSEDKSIYIEDVLGTSVSGRVYNDKNLVIMEESDVIHLYVDALTTDTTLFCKMWVDEYDIGRIR